MQNNNAGITVVHKQAGQPYAGKVFAAVHAHLSDVPYYAAGLCARLIAEGYTGYIIRTTNDEKSGHVHLPALRHIAAALHGPTRFGYFSFDPTDTRSVPF